MALSWEQFRATNGPTIIIVESTAVVPVYSVYSNTNVFMKYNVYNFST